MKKLIVMAALLCFSSALFAQSRSVSNEEAKQIAEKFVSCSGYTTKTLPAQLCGDYKVSCSDDTFPCNFLEKNAFGYFSQKENGEKGWIIVFRTRGRHKSKITGVKIAMNSDGTQVKTEKTKVFLRLIEERY